MSNIFKEQKSVNEHPNRNNFDLSKKINLSMKFGTLYPVYCQPVVPGDSFSIDTAFNLKLQPVIFPVQTKMRAHMHYFYVRNKNLWSNWENWISNLVSNTDHPHPFISLPDNVFKTGSIHDFLGVPTSLVSKSPVSARVNMAFDGVSPKTAEYGSSSYCWYSEVFDRRITKTFVFGKGLLLGFETLISAPDSSDYKLYFYDSNDTLIGSSDSFKVDATQVVLSDELVSSINDSINLGKSCYFVVSCMFYRPEALSVLPSGEYFVSVVFSSSGVYDYTDLDLDLYSRHLHINALPYRAYESVFYTYYNNTVLNPLKINNQVQYNRYVTNLGDGADVTPYHLFQRNYELDFLTSALPSPQQGVAPVVGMTALGDITIEDENGLTTAHATIDNDGTITKVVLTSPAASNEHARTAMNIASCGMSISDFRQTNALQRFLETNIRKGYRYMDFIAGHFGKEPEYRELDLPEFIGGFSRDVQVSTVVSNADTLGVDSGAALGEYGGYAQVLGVSNHSVRHYCDDYGFIIGILSVVPTPCYSQLLPKHMIAPDNFLDYYFPEFSSSGLQPITYKEVCPIQSYIDSFVDRDKRLEDTFGYQRPNYDLVSAVDEVHGDFRVSLKDYLINRQFDSRPELGQSFISINPSEINDIFVNTNPDDDTIIGEIGFSVHAKRPIPRVVIPNLGK